MTTNVAYERLHDVEGVFAYRIFLDPPRATHQSTATILRRKDGTPFIGKRGNSDLVRWRRSFEAIIQCCKANCRWKAHPDDRPMAVEITSYFQMPLTGKEPMRLKVTKPDLDNHAKVILDALVSTIVLIDDGQVSQLVLMKQEVNPRAGHKPAIDIIVRPMTPLFFQP